MLCWEGAWCVGVVLDRSVLCLDVSSYVWSNICSEWLQVVSGRVLCGGSKCICGSLSKGFIYNSTVPYIT